MHTLTQSSRIAILSVAIMFASAKDKPAAVPAGATIYVDSNNGFDTFILAALQAKHVPLKVVSSADRADFIMDSSLFHSSGFVAVGKVASTTRTSEASFKITSKSGDIVWAYSTRGGRLIRDKQAVAEQCARHLKEVVK